MTQKLNEETKIITREIDGVERHRAAQATIGKIDEDKRTVEISFASEIEVNRGYEIEILEMTREAANLSRLNSGGAVLSEHDRKVQIGVVEKAWIGEDRRAHAILRFSKNPKGEEEFRDICDGIRTNVSFGYVINKHRLERGAGGGLDKVTATEWTGMEISIVSIPQDYGVGVGRSVEETAILGTGLPGIAAIQEIPAQEERTVKNLEETQITMIDKDKPGADTVVITREAEIMAYASVFNDVNATSLARSFAADPNKSVADLQRALQEQYKPSAATPQVEAPTELGLTEKQKQSYSLVRAIRAQADGNWKGAEFERECSDAVAKKLDRESGGFFVPSDVQSYGQRDLSVGGGLTTGGALVGTDHLADSFIDILRSKMKMMSLGVRMLTGLVGDVQIPRQDGAGTVYWVDEGVAPTESQQVFGQLTLSPKTCGAVTEFTRKLLLQSSPSIEALVKSDLAAIMAREIDRVIIDGSGSAGQPRGILNTTGVEEVAMIGGDWGYEDAVNMESQIGEDNAPDATAFLMRPTVRGVLKTRPKIGTVYPVFVCGEDNKVIGYKAEATTQMPTNTILFGDYSQVIVGEWGVLELEANRLGSGFRAGNIEVRALQSIDVAIRYVEAFKKNEAFA